MDKMCPFSKYRNIFGKVGQGIHAIRFMNVSIIDYIMSIILSLILSFITSIPIDIMTILVFMVAIVSHILFGVKTSTIKYLGLDCQ